MTNTQITLNLDALTLALKKACAVAPRGGDTPLLNNVFLHTDGTQLLVHATDYEFHLQTRIPALQLQRGAPAKIAVRLKCLSDLVKQMEGRQIVLDFDEPNKRLILTSEDGAQSSLASACPEDSFPVMPSGDFRLAARIGVGSLVSILRQAGISSAEESTRFAIDGVLLSFGRNQVSAVALDGHRLSVVSAEAPKTKSVSGIIPIRTERIISLLHPEQQLDVRFTKEHFEFLWTDGSLAVKLSDKNFPNYKSVIPTENKAIAVFAKDALTRIIQQVLSIIPKRGQPTAVFTFAKDTQIVNVKASDSTADDSPSFASQVPAQYQGDSFQIALNPRFLKDFLSVMTGDRLELRMNDGERPVLFSAQGQKDTFNYIVMPVKA